MPNIRLARGQPHIGRSCSQASSISKPRASPLDETLLVSSPMVFFQGPPAILPAPQEELENGLTQVRRELALTRRVQSFGPDAALTRQILGSRSVLSPQQHLSICQNSCF